jgi:hypothetical protein
MGLGIVVYACNPGYKGDIGRKSCSEASPGQKLKTLSEK